MERMKPESISDRFASFTNGKRTIAYGDLVNWFCECLRECETELDLCEVKSIAKKHYAKYGLPPKVEALAVQMSKKVQPASVAAINAQTIQEHARCERLIFAFGLKNEETAEALMFSKVAIFGRYIETMEDRSQAAIEWSEFHCALWYECSCDVHLHQGMGQIVEQSRSIGAASEELQKVAEEIGEDSYKKRHSLAGGINRLRNMQKMESKKDGN